MRVSVANSQVEIMRFFRTNKRWNFSRDRVHEVPIGFKMYLPPTASILRILCDFSYLRAKHFPFAEQIFLVLTFKDAIRTLKTR